MGFFLFFAVLVTTFSNLNPIHILETMTTTFIMVTVTKKLVMSKYSTFTGGCKEEIDWWQMID